MMQLFIARCKQVFGIDLRTLALFRVVLALACIAQLAAFWPDVFAFLDDRGLHPRRDAFTDNSFYSWSLYYISGDVLWAYFLFILTLLSSLALLVGYRSRTAAVITWILIGSLWTRARIFSNGGQMQLVLLLFWAMFLPLSARFSVDAALNKRPKENSGYVSWATFAILIQEMYMYFFGAMLKTGDAWRISHDAIYYVTHASDLNSPLGAYFLANWPEFDRILSTYVYYLELFAVVFLFTPFKTAWARLAILPLLISLHLGFGLFLSIGIFPLVSIAGLMVFVPGLFWDKFIPWWNRSRQGITLYYDQDCGFCRKTCQIFKELSLSPETRIISAQQVPEIYEILQRDNSWVVEDGKGMRRTRWDAVAWVWRRSPILWPLGLVFLPRFMQGTGDSLYAFIAHHRARFGILSEHLLRERDTSLAFNLHPITQGFIASLSVIIMIWNIGGLRGQTLGSWYRPMNALLSVFDLKQGWMFFAPDSRQVAIWVVIEGKLVGGGDTVDVFHDTLSPPVHDRPQHGYDAFPSNYWWEFFSHSKYNKYLQATIGSYFCSTWNESNPDMPIEEMTFTAYKQRTPPPLVEKALKVEKITAFSYSCSATAREDY